MITGDRETRELISSALAAEDHPDKAFLAANPASAIMRPSSVLPGGAEVVRFDSFPHPGASFYVGVVGGKVFYLTESPDAYTEMMRAAGLRVASPTDAVAVARWFVETTRAMNVFSGVLRSVDDIPWASGPLAPPPEQIGALVHRLRGVIASPSAEPRQGGHLVTLYVLRGSTLQRRTITVTDDGGIQERVDEVAKDLPVPISM
ncbi:hypothetical protein [Actinoallomurus iriomotensis]|uniref:Uncharacterized protein n=1 Tax=Actinoallomurus iriomotensis TaxID=478107 RepID=A0A9W6VZ76_9ACTN|nr:hypothetical protein [Actinoallomurus iriomotensis]GLY90878.1 hypothetical protein Airi02_088070 [Actinoallomurus iriomotensis]